MRPRKPILILSKDEMRANQLRFVLKTRMHVEVDISFGFLGNRKYQCAVLTEENMETIDLLRAREIPTLAIGTGPSHADREVSGDSMMDFLEAVRLMCKRKRGPKARAA